MKKSAMDNFNSNERREDINLKKSVFSDSCCNEFKEMDKHEIIIKICDVMGSSPMNLRIAEEIFEKIKFDLTKYVIHHEYSKEDSIRARLLIWLDTMSNPGKAKAVANFMKKYIK